jgi:hypothetical protein
VFAGSAAAAWPTGIYTGTLRNPGYGTRRSTQIKLFVTKTQLRVLGARLSFRCPDAKARMPVKIGPLKPVRIRVRPDTGGAQLALNQKVGSIRVTIAGGITPGRPLQGLLDASRETPSGFCEDSALFTARPH